MSKRIDLGGGLSIPEADWSWRWWRLAFRPKRRDFKPGILPDTTLDAHGAWDRWFWRIYWLRERYKGKNLREGP